MKKSIFIIILSSMFIFLNPNEVSSEVRIEKTTESIQESKRCVLNTNDEEWKITIKFSRDPDGGLIIDICIGDGC